MRRAAAVAGLVLALLVTMPASVLAARSWTVVADPDWLAINVTTDVDVTVTNTGSSGNGIRCVKVQVPSDFEIEDVAIVTAGGLLLNWTASWSGSGSSVVVFRSGLLGLPIGENDEAVFRITGHAHTPGTWNWTANAADNQGSGNNCGANPFPTRSVPFDVVGPPTPAPTPAPTPPPTPTPAPTPAPTPTPGPTATAGPGATPAPTPKASSPPGSTPKPTAAPGASVAPGATPGSPSAGASPDASGSPGPSPEGSPVASDLPDPSSASPLATAPGSGGSPGDTPGSAFEIAGGGSAGGGGAVSPAGLDGTVIEALNGLPGGVLAWAYPTFVLAIPGLLLLLAVGAQAFGALAWLPLVRRRLGDFGLRSSPHRRGEG